MQWLCCIVKFSGLKKPNSIDNSTLVQKWGVVH
jgi:hypothetical protein